MSFNSTEKVYLFMEKCLKSFKLTDLKDLVPEYFDIAYEDVEKGIMKRKLAISKQNVVELVLLGLKKTKWPATKILTTAFEIELEFTQRYHGRFLWTAHKFIGDSSKDEISDLESDLRRAIRNEKKDALILTKEADGLLFLSVVMKSLKEIGLYKKPYYIALSECGKYFFIRRSDPDIILETLTTTLGYKKFKAVKLDGRDLKSLLKLLVRRENVDVLQRPVYKGGEAVETEMGVDMTLKKSYDDYYNECVDGDDEIYLQHYTITALKCPWLGPRMQAIREMEFESSVTLSGNVARIIKAMPAASMICPPFPDFFVNFSVEGKNRTCQRLNEEQLQGYGLSEEQG